MKNLYSIGRGSARFIFNTEKQGSADRLSQIAQDLKEIGDIDQGEYATKKMRLDELTEKKRKLEQGLASAKQKKEVALDSLNKFETDDNNYKIKKGTRTLRRRSREDHESHQKNVEAAQVLIEDTNTELVKFNAENGAEIEALETRTSELKTKIDKQKELIDEKTQLEEQVIKKAKSEKKELKEEVITNQGKSSPPNNGQWSTDTQNKIGESIAEDIKNTAKKVHTAADGETVSAITLGFARSGALKLKRSIYAVKARYEKGARPTMDEINKWNEKSPHKIPDNIANDIITGKDVPMGYANFLTPGQFVWLDGDSTIVIGKESKNSIPTDEEEITPQPDLDGTPQYK